MAAEVVAVVSSVLGCATVAVTLVSPCLREPITEGYNCFRKRKESLDALTAKMAALEQQLAQVQLQSKEKVLSKSLLVSQWLHKADEFIKEVADLKFNKKIREINCCGLPNYIEQYKAGKQIEERIVRLEALEKGGQKFFDVQESDVVGQMKEAKEPVGEAIKKKVEEIMKYVTEKEGCTVLVYGMAGSGKTRVVSRVNDLILSAYNSGDEYFDNVIWVTAGSNPLSIENFQNKIAEKLQIDLKNATGNIAQILERALKGKRFLIILDDMWWDLSLESIGIPRPTKDNGLKVIIVSGSAPWFSKIKFDKKVEIEPLLDKAAEELFLDESGMKLSMLKEDSIRVTAKEMIEECEGLPLAIVSLAETLKGLKKNGLDDVAAWKEALEEIPSHLESRNEKAFNRLKDGFRMLNEEAQQCFLYCALYPSHHKMEKKKLVEYWFWEGFLEGTERRIEGRTRAREILDKLIGTYLVKEVDKEHIKMSNIVRQMAVHLTQKTPKFLIKAGTNLCKWDLHEEDLSEVVRASLMSNQIPALMGEPKFLKLSTLLLQHNNICHLSDNFFRSMPNIKVLDLSHTRIPSLQKSAFSNLRKLRALLLRDCPNLESLPSLANSKELLVLDLYNTPTKQLPDGINELKKLIRLNLSHTKVGEFEAELAPALASLEELFIITNDISAGFLWGSEKGATSIEKLGALPNLAILHINFPDAESFITYVNGKQHYLTKFKFWVGSSCEEAELPKNSIVFSKTDFPVKGNEVILPVPEDTSELHIMSNKGLLWLPNYRLDSLKVIKISGCESLVYLFQSGGEYNLPNLHTILIENCQRMQALIESRGHCDNVADLQPRFRKLRVIRISYCENLVYLFPTKMLSLFSNLDEISISRRSQSKQVEEESNSEEPASDASLAIHDPKLENQELDELVWVDPLELNKTMYKGEKTVTPDGQIIWSFLKQRMKIKYCSQPKPRVGSFSVPKTKKRNSSFGSIKEAIPSRGTFSRTVSSTNLLVHANTELTADIVGKSNLLKGKDGLSNLHPAISTPRSSKLDKEVTETNQSTHHNAAEDDQEEGLNLFSSAYLHLRNYFINPF